MLAVSLVAVNVFRSSGITITYSGPKTDDGK